MKPPASLAPRYQWLITLLGGISLFWPSWSSQHVEAPLLALVIALAAVAHVLRAEGATTAVRYELSWVAVGFAFVLWGRPAALLVITAAQLAEWIWHHNRPWTTLLFRMGAAALATGLAALVHAALSQGEAPWETAGLLGVLAAMVIIPLVNHFVKFGLVRLANPEAAPESWTAGRLSFVIDLTALGLGAVAALGWLVAPLMVVLVLTPLYLIYSTLKVPALQRQNQTDAKTGLYNARHFHATLEKELARANRFSRPLTVVMADLDHLRHINNTYGHLAGDAVLIAVAQIADRAAREHGLVARFGGEEFAILLPETSADQAYLRIEAIRAAIEAADITAPTTAAPIRVTMSFGVASRDGHDLPAKELLHRADLAVYQAKQTGRNRVCLYSTEGDTPTTHIAPRAAAEGAELAPRAPAAVTTPARPTPPPPTPAALPAQPRPAHWLSAYIAAVAGLALGMWALTVQPAEPVDWFCVAVFATLVFITEWWSLEIYARDTSVSTAAAVLVVGAIICGPIGVAVLALTQALTSLIKHRSPVSRFVFNVGNQLIASLLGVWLVRLTGRPFVAHPLWLEVMLTVAASGLAYLSSTWLVSGALHLNSGQPVRAVWVERFRWLWPYYLALGLVAYALIYSYSKSGVLGVAVTLVPLFLLRFGQQEYLKRTTEMVTQLRTTHTELSVRAGHIAQLNADLIEALAFAVDVRDPFVQSHSRQVARYAVLTAEALGLPPERVATVQKAGLLHDIGKLGIPETILFKPGRLTQEEYRLIQQHAVLGAEMLAPITALADLIPFVRHHHEHYDGRGYPDGLREQAIPLEARILSVADAVEAMASDRPYRNGLPWEAIQTELQRQSGAQFDPVVVAAFEQAVARQGLQLIENSAHHVTQRLADGSRPLPIGLASRSFSASRVAAGR